MVRSATQDTDHSLGDLVAQAARDISQLVRYEIELAKSELRVDLRRIGVAAVLAGFGALAGCLIVILLCFALAHAIHQWGLPGGMATAFALTAAAVFIVALIALGFAWLRLKGLTKMRRTRKTVTEDIAMLRKGTGDGAGQAGELAGAAGKPAPLPGPPVR